MNRRNFLKSVLMNSAAAALPFSLGGLSRLAHGAGSEKLKIVFAVIPDGFGVDAYGGYDNGLWFPNAVGNDTDQFSLNVMSDVLADYRSKSLYLQGTILSSGTGGHNGWQTILRDSAGSKTSIDLLLGQALPGNNPAIKRIYAGPHATVGASWCVSYQDNNMLIPETSPYQLFDKVFDGVSAGGGEPVSSKAHLFDPVAGQIQSIRSQLSGIERAKLDTHLDAVEQVVVDLQNSVPISGCSPTSAEPDAGMSISSPDYREEVTRSHADIVAAGLSCGVSRVATLQIGRSADQVVIKSVSASRNPHDCAHRYGSVDEWRDSRLWYTQQVKYLLDRLAVMPDPDVPGDSLLDHTLVVFTSEMADGAPEHMQDVPITLIGGACGKINNGAGNGRYFSIQDQGDRSHWKMGKAVDIQRVWATIANAVGVQVPYSGDVSIVNGIFS